MKVYISALLSLSLLFIGCDDDESTTTPPAGDEAGAEVSSPTAVTAGTEAGVTAGTEAETEAGVTTGTEAGIQVIINAPCSSSNRGCPDLNFVRIGGGSFMMGSNEDDNEQPIHMVTV